MKHLHTGASSLKIPPLSRWNLGFAMESVQALPGAGTCQFALSPDSKASAPGLEEAHPQMPSETWGKGFRVCRMSVPLGGRKGKEREVVREGLTACFKGT